jgi:sialic acid synthase SpsE
MGVGVAVGAVALGATVVEKHFTLSRAEGRDDSAFSLEPSELISLIIETERAWKALGKIHYGPTDVEQKSFQLRRSLYVSNDTKVGEVLAKKILK